MRLQDVLLRGDRASQPLPADVAPGTLYYVTDEAVTERCSDDGTTWEDYSDGGGFSALNVSAGIASANVTNLVFSNSNGVSFGLNGSTITGSHAINLSAGLAANNLSLFVLSNSNNVSFGLNGSTITATATVAAPASSLTAIRISAGGGNVVGSAFTFSNSNNVEFGINASTITASVSSSLTNIKISAGLASALMSALTFDNANNVSFGLVGSVVTATATVATSLTAINVSAGVAANNLSALVFSNFNNVSFGLNGSTITATASGGAAGGGATFDNWQNYVAINDQRSGVYANNIYIMPMPLPGALSGHYLRVGMSLMSLQNRTFGATSANTSWSAQMAVTFHNVLYTRGTGASSESFFSLSTYGAGWTVRTAFTAGGNGSEWTASLLMTAPFETGTLQISTSYACTSASYVINSGGGGANFANAMNNSRWIEVPFNTSLPASNYYLGFGRSTATTNNGATGLSTTNFEFCMLASSYTTAALSRLGSSGGNSTGPQFGMGVITTNVTVMSTSGFNLTQLIGTAAGALLVPFGVL